MHNMWVVYLPFVIFMQIEHTITSEIRLICEIGIRSSLPQLSPDQKKLSELHSRTEISWLQTLYPLKVIWMETTIS